MKMKKRSLNELKQLEKELDAEFVDIDLDKNKNEFINQIKNLNKTEMFEVKKYTIWQRIRKTLGL
jgi:hypothetical protein